VPTTTRRDNGATKTFSAIRVFRHRLPRTTALLESLYSSSGDFPLRCELRIIRVAPSCCPKWYETAWMRGSALFLATTDTCFKTLCATYIVLIILVIMYVFSPKLEFILCLRCSDYGFLELDLIESRETHHEFRAFLNQHDNIVNASSSLFQ